ncbi:unnamed protein product [Cylicocyclus nassatus]|uniref:Uncharacterized protein n=1 Tax=Cylicocyclus nassatus TaxID=53992 RepID=A0AA36GT63_CYLNA|nr:unnamed protein product [Cylicocyclus nassatus]
MINGDTGDTGDSLLNSYLIPSSIPVASNTIQSSSTKAMLTIILLALFVTSEAPASTILYTTYPYLPGLKKLFITITRNKLKEQLQRQNLPFIRKMFKFIPKNDKGQLAMLIWVSEVPECDLVKKMAKESKKLDNHVRYATVKCRGNHKGVRELTITQKNHVRFVQM